MALKQFQFLSLEWYKKKNGIFLLSRDRDTIGIFVPGQIRDWDADWNFVPGKLRDRDKRPVPFPLPALPSDF